jgi:autotransporter-associated beta strand protein
LRIFVSLLLICSLAFGGNHFSPKGPTAIWDSSTAAGILNGSGTWDINNILFNYDTGGIRNSAFCQGCNVSFGGASGGTAGVVTVNGIQKINSFTFNPVPLGNFTLTGGEISCVNFSPCTYTANYSGTIGSVISGTKDLIKQGAQTLTLSGINTYTGNTNVNAGTLEATTNVEAIPGNLIIAAGATGHLNVTGTKTFPNTVSGSGTLKVTAGGTVGTVTTLSGNLSGLIGLFDIYPSAGGGGKINLTNTTQVNTPPIGSTIKLNNGATIFLDKALNYESNFSLYGGTTGEALGQLRVENATVTGPVTLFANSTIGSNVNPGIISGGISGVGFGITKQGPGKITLNTSSNTYTGATTVDGGNLTLGPGGTLVSSGITVNNGGTMEFSASTNSNNIGSGSMPITVNTGGLLSVTTAHSMGYTALNNYANVTINGGTFNLTANQYIGTLSLTNGTVSGTGAVQFFFTVPTAINTISDSTISSPMNINAAAQTINVGAGATLLVSGNIGFNSGASGAITKTGTGILLFSGNNTYTANTTVSAGTLQLGDGVKTNNIIPATNLITDNSVLIYNTPSDISHSGVISGSGTFTKQGTGILTLNGNNTYTGNTTISGGGTLQIGGAGSLGSGSYAGAISNSGTFQYSSSSAQTLSGVISGAGTFTKDTSTTSTLTLTGANTYTGITNVNAGTLQISNGTTGTLGNNSNTSVASGATLIFNQSSPTIYTYAGNLTGSGTVLKNNTSTEVRLSGDNSAFAGVVNTTNGVLRVVNSNSGSALASWNFSTGAGLALNVANTSYSFGSISGDGSIFAGGGVLGTTLIEGALNTDTTFSGPIDPAATTMAVTKVGTGIWTLSGANTYRGVTNVDAGTLKLTNTNTSPTYNIASGAVLELNASGADRDGGSSQTFNGLGTLRKTGPNGINWGANIGTFALGTGALIDVQGGTFTGGNSANEVWTSNLSDLNVVAGATFDGVEANVRVDALTGAGTISTGHPHATYANFTFGVDNGDGTFSGVLVNFAATPGNFVKAGNGTQILTGANTYTGTTSINGGTLQISGAGSLGPGTYAGAISIASGKTLQYSSSTNQTLSGVISGAGNILKDTSTSTLSVTANNTTHTGSVTVNKGTFSCSYPSGVGSSITVASGATLSLGDNGSGLNAWSAPLTFSGPDSGTNALITLNSLSSLADHTWSGTIALNTPTTFNTAHNVRPNYFTGVISGASPLTVSSSGGAEITFSGNNNYSGGTTVSTGSFRTTVNTGAGTGTITLGDANTGTRAISWFFQGGGTPANNVVVSSQGTGSVTIGTNSGGTYTTPTGAITLNRATSFSDGTGDRTTFNGKISGNPGTITISAGRVTFGNAGNDFVGNLSIADGAIYQNDSPTALPVTTDVNLNGNGTFRLNNGSTHAIDGLNGGGTDGVSVITTNAATLSLGNNNGSGTFSGVISNGGATLTLVKNGTGTAFLYGANTYTGTTTINSGTIRIYGPSNLGSTSMLYIGSGATLFLYTSGSGQNYTTPVTFSASTGNLTFSQIDYARDNTWSGNITLTGNANITGSKCDGVARLTGTISGAGRLTLGYGGGCNEAFVVSGNNSYTGGTTITDGRVNCGHANALGTVGSITVNAGATLNKGGTGCGGARITCNGTCNP